MNKKTVLKALVILVFISLIFVLPGCGKDMESKVSDERQSNKIEIVKVESGSITPTLSAKTDIKKATPFVILSENSGPFKSKVSETASVKKGDVIGYVGDVAINAPVDAIVLNVCCEGNVPKNYPVFELKYTGFSVEVKATNFLQMDSEVKKMKAKFQVQDGIGPADILAVVLSSEETDKIQCLISHEHLVRLGQLVTVVITTESRSDVMILPVSVVAGRLKTGIVSKVTNGEIVKTNVVLGATDGAYIEIISGINVGDQVQTIPPNIDPREN